MISEGHSILPDIACSPWSCHMKRQLDPGHFSFSHKHVKCPFNQPLISSYWIIISLRVEITYSQQKIKKR